jgi:S-(hydroxymethyl)glutathione dehydrogenase/alcohol dehydrogenase
MKIKAAVCYAPHTPLAIEELELDPPKEGEVLVKIASAGVCHSDYHVMKGEWSPPLPMVLGHEAAGVVEAVGPGVTLSKPGDHVILNFRPNCGWCRYCATGRPVLCNGSDSPRWTMFDGTVRRTRPVVTSTTSPAWLHSRSTPWCRSPARCRSAGYAPDLAAWLAAAS